MKCLYSQSEILLEKILKDADYYVSALKFHHMETYGHSEIVSLLCIDLGIENDLNLKTLGYAGLLHDIGKVAVPRSILDKRGALDDYERMIMESHAYIGFLILRDFQDSDVPIIVASHHDYSAGNRNKSAGTLGNLLGLDIPNNLAPLVQIVAVADIFDALSSRRPYKEPFRRERIEEILIKEYSGDISYVQQVLRRWTPL